MNFAQRKDEKGYPSPKVPAIVYFPTAIHEAVMKVRGSDKYPQNALNAKMPELFGQFEPVPGYWLSSSAAWFVSAREDEADKGLVIVWQTRPNYEKISDTMNPEFIMGRRLLMRFSVGCLHARGIFGNAGG